MFIACVVSSAWPHLRNLSSLRAFSGFSGGKMLQWSCRWSECGFVCLLTGTLQPVSPWRWLFSILVPLVLTVRALKRRTLDRSGALGGECVSANATVDHTGCNVSGAACGDEPTENRRSTRRLTKHFGFFLDQGFGFPAHNVTVFAIIVSWENEKDRTSDILKENCSGF